MIKTFLPEELEAIVRQEANAEHISPGAYVAMLVKEALEGKTLNNESDEEVFEGDGPVDRSHRVCINLYGKDADQLKIRAGEMGLSPTAYIRRIAYTKEYVSITVPTDDLREFIDEFIKYEQSYTAAVGYIKRGEGEVFTQDLGLLKDYMSEIRDLFKKQVELSYSMRLKTQNKMMRDLKDEVDKAKG